LGKKRNLMTDHISDNKEPPSPAQPSRKCQNPNHALTDGSPLEHEIGPSCMAAQPSASVEEIAREYSTEFRARDFPDVILRLLYVENAAAAIREALAPAEQRIRELKKVLESLDNQGGLGYEKHNMIRKVFGKNEL
jgi:hypothetical protein